jgi:ribosomal protein L11 methyltransferase
VEWCEARVVTGRDSMEAVAEKLMELGAGGVAVEDWLDWETARREGLGDLFPDTEAADHDYITIRGYFPLSFLSGGNEQLAGFLARLPGFGLSGASLYVRTVDEAGWEQAWKQYWQPTPVGRRLLVLPAWLDAGDTDRLVLRLDPGAAFGTGTHETTRMCLELLEECLSGGETVLDLGCGSGILSLAARLLGAGDVSGVDYDEAAVRSSRENARLNGMDSLRFCRADLFADEAWVALGQAAVVTANLTADMLVAISPRIAGVLPAGGRLVASGIIRDREEEVADVFIREGYGIIERKRAGQWAALLMELKS